jgi:hypothetical protein
MVYLKDLFQKKTKLNIKEKRPMIKKILITLAVIASMGVGAAFAAVGTTALTQVISQGTLTISAPATATFSAKTFSFASQTSSANALGTVGATDARGSFVGWKIDITGADWSDGTHTMDYNGDGTTTGQLSIDNPVVGDVTVIAGNSDAASWTFGADDAFDGSTSTINMVTVPATFGSGNYNIANTKASQFIPAQQPAGSYNMTLTYTIS